MLPLFAFRCGKISTIHSDLLWCFSWLLYFTKESYGSFYLVVVQLHVTIYHKEFYAGNLITATKYDRLILPKKRTPGVYWIDIVGNVIRPRGGGAQNEIEAKGIVDELVRLSTEKYRGEVGVIAPFRKQADLIKNMMITEYPDVFDEMVRKNHLEINTVHQFQGDERDVIYFSSTITFGATDGMKLFLNGNGNLFNVAITRARAMLIAVGDFDYCSGCEIKYLQNFAHYAKQKMLEREKEAMQYSVEQTEMYPEVSNMDQVSNWEKLFYSKLYRAGIKTLPQYPVDKYRLDLAIISGSYKLDIEVDGEMYHKNWDGELCYRDQLRNQRLFELGWDVIRFWVPEIRDDMNGCIKKIRDWCNDHQDNSETISGNDC